ncbi:MAG: hypothetical protein OEX19_10340 [Gammaproteobacteria bacterium]|nr:hypothetical protein [Gammaproteobacteria bacterium]
MKGFILWLVHFPAGSLSLLAAFVALYYPKGSLQHKKAGNYFTIGMLTMLVSGSILGWLKESLDDIFLAALVFYSVFTAWLTVHHKKGETNWLEYLALGWILILGLAAASVDSTWENVRDPGVYPFWIGLVLLFAIGDIHNLYRRGLSGSQRIARHLWRNCFSLVWAVLAFGDKIIKMLDSTIEKMPLVLFGPGALVLCVMFYWLYRLLRGKSEIAYLSRSQQLNIKEEWGP